MSGALQRPTDAAQNYRFAPVVTEADVTLLVGLLGYFRVPGAEIVGIAFALGIGGPGTPLSTPRFVFLPQSFGIGRVVVAMAM